MQVLLYNGRKTVVVYGVMVTVSGLYCDCLLFTRGDRPIKLVLVSRQ